MAWYHRDSDVKKSTSDSYKREFKPGEKAEWPGIYHCINCGDEIAIAGGHTLPAQNHYQHTSQKPIIWRLAVYAEQKK